MAISFFVKRKAATGCRIFYARRPEVETRDDKLAFLDGSQLSELAVEEVRPDARANWINQTQNDFGNFIPVASKLAKAAKTRGQEMAVFQSYSFGVVTNRDEWVYGDTSDDLLKKLHALVETYNRDRERLASIKDPRKIAALLNEDIKWTRAVKRDLGAGVKYRVDESLLTEALYRPFVTKALYFSSALNEMQNLMVEYFGPKGAIANRIIVFSDPTSQKPFMVLAADRCPDMHLVGAASGSVVLPAKTSAETRLDNITDWALDQFRAHYEAQTPSPAPREKVAAKRPDEGAPQDEAPRAKRTKAAKSAETVARDAIPSSGPAGHLLPRAGEGERPVSKGAIFHYVYAVLHDPIYREKYAQNLKREFPRIPFYDDFWRWADWGERLMALHIGYETVEPWPLARTDTPDANAAAAGLKPKPILRADHDHGVIVLDSETQLSGVPAEAWAYKLGNRCALEWILDQHKEKTPKDPTIREKFNTYRFADYKEKVVDLLKRVTRVSVETMAIVEAMRATPR